MTKYPRSPPKWTLWQTNRPSSAFFHHTNDAKQNFQSLEIFTQQIPTISRLRSSTDASRSIFSHSSRQLFISTTTPKLSITFQRGEQKREIHRYPHAGSSVCPLDGRRSIIWMTLLSDRPAGEYGIDVREIQGTHTLRKHYGHVSPCRVSSPSPIVRRDAGNFRN